MDVRKCVEMRVECDRLASVGATLANLMGGNHLTEDERAAIGQALEKVWEVSTSLADRASGMETSIERGIGGQWCVFDKKVSQSGNSLTIPASRELHGLDYELGDAVTIAIKRKKRKE